MDSSKNSLLRRLFLGPASAVMAAVVGGVFSLVAALIPEFYPPANSISASADSPSNQSSPAFVIKNPHLTYGTWTLVESKDDEGNDWSNSVLKFTHQQPTDDGFELEGVFEWRRGHQLVGKEYVKGNFVEATRNLYIEGQKIESEGGDLEVGSFSARLAEDNRQLLEGTWGNTIGNRGGIPGTWRARR